MTSDMNKLHMPTTEDYSDLTFGDKLKAVRKARGLTRKALADRAGIGESSIVFMKIRVYCQMYLHWN